MGIWVACLLGWFESDWLMESWVALGCSLFVLFLSCLGSVTDGIWLFVAGLFTQFIGKGCCWRWTWEMAMGDAVERV